MIDQKGKAFDTRDDLQNGQAMTTEGPAYKPKQCPTIDNNPNCEKIFTPLGARQEWCISCGTLHYKKIGKKHPSIRKQELKDDQIKKDIAAKRKKNSKPKKHGVPNIPQNIPPPPEKKIIEIKEPPEIVPFGDLNDCLDFILSHNLTSFDSISFIRNKKRVTIEELE